MILSILLDIIYYLFLFIYEIEKKREQKPYFVFFSESLLEFIAGKKQVDD